MLMNTNFRETVLARTVLITTLDSLEDVEQRETALKLVREWYDISKCESVGDTVVKGAQARILGERVSLPVFEPTKKPADRLAFEVLAKAWLTWAAGGDPKIILKANPKPSEYGGAIHLMTLEPWGDAIKSLAENDAGEAQRFFRRSIELGRQCETESNDIIKWAYAASFFHLGK
jgi:hypothetical protein